MAKIFLTNSFAGYLGLFKKVHWVLCGQDKN